MWFYSKRILILSCVGLLSANACFAKDVFVDPVKDAEAWAKEWFMMDSPDDLKSRAGYALEILENSHGKELGSLMGIDAWAKSNGFTWNDDPKYHRPFWARLDGAQENGLQITVSSGDHVFSGAQEARQLIWRPPSGSNHYLRVRYIKFGEGADPADLKNRAEGTLDAIIAYARNYTKQYANALLRMAGEEVIEPTVFDFQVVAAGKEIETFHVTAEDYLPSGLNVQGVVVDEEGKPVTNATIQSESFEETAVTDEQGQFVFEAFWDQEKGTQDLAQSNIRVKMTEKLLEFSVELGIDEKVYANNKKIPAVVTVYGGGVPWRNREVHIQQSALFLNNSGAETPLLELPQQLSQDMTTSETGELNIELMGPMIVEKEVPPYVEQSVLFPVTGSVVVQDRKTARTTNADYTIESPLPKIGKFRVPGNVDEEHWQITPSTLTIEDPDSNSFTVIVEAVGGLRVLRGPSGRNRLVIENAGKEIAFHYQPPKIGYDLQNQPDLAKELFDATIKTAVGLTTAALENYSLKRFGKMVPAGGEWEKVPGNIDAAFVHVKNATAALDRATDTTNLLTDADGRSPGDTVLQSYEAALGFMETVFDILGKDASMKWGHIVVAKAVFEYSKVFYSAYYKYQEILSTYQDVMYLPITVTVIDEAGHEVSAIQQCAVKVWKKL